MENHGGDFLVVGFFTPDYFDLASALSGNLNGLRISHHLYACEKQKGEWGHQTLRKPSIVKRARLDYPDKALILMDVDCAVRGDVSGILDNNSDIAFPMGRKPMKNGTALKPGTRVMLIRPSTNSDRLIDLWDQKCRLDIQPVENDEIRLQMAIEDSAGTFSFGILPREFTGVEIRKSNAKDIIVHDSARDEARPLGRLRKVIKANFIYLRSLLLSQLLGQRYNSRL
ncbi:MAG: hypothetical protein KGO80_03305 [Bacteroidetes bacterium]|nr:hypothetical protein [Bacteroidota bacterium]